MDIAFLISHLPDPRYKKRFSLLQEMYQICVIYWNKRGEKLSFSDISVEQHEIAIKANQTSPLKRIPEWIEYGKRATAKLKEICPRCIYVGNFDMLLIAAQYKKKYDSSVKIIYEIADLHRYLVDPSKNILKMLLKCILVSVESILVKSVDLLVITSWKFYDVYYSRWLNKDQVVLLPNMPNAADFADYSKKKHDDFTVGYVGTIRYKNQLKMLISAAEKAQVNVFFAGAASDDEIETLCRAHNDYCSYWGPYNYSKEIVQIYEKCDVIYSVYDADMPNVQVALPNKLYESILCELPILVATGTYLSELVEQWKVGISVSHKDEGELVEVLRMLKENTSDYNEICISCAEQKERVDLPSYNKVLLDKIYQLFQ